VGRAHARVAPDNHESRCDRRRRRNLREHGLDRGNVAGIGEIGGDLFPISRQHASVGVHDFAAIVGALIMGRRHHNPDDLAGVRGA